MANSPVPIHWSITVSDGVSNQAPTVDAGADQSITLGDTVTLAGTASDDGLPASSLTTEWTQSGGTGTATFTDDSALNTVVSFSAAGSYTLQLTANDGELTSTDTLVVTVNESTILPDADNDGNPDVSDPDDDNDGINDNMDPFALDPDNGRSTSIPLTRSFNDSQSAGLLFDRGFSGLMSNGNSDYQSLFDPSSISTNGGLFTVNNTTGGDPYEFSNNQDNAFQFGIDVTDQSPAFTIRTRVNAPFNGVTTPQVYQSVGMYIGNGDQDNYIKLVLNSQGPNGGLQFAQETFAAFNELALSAADIYATDAVDLLLSIDPASGDVTASYQIISAGQPGALIPVAGTASLPSGWIDGPNGLAVGLISTSFNTTPYDASWDFIEITVD